MFKHVGRLPRQAWAVLVVAAVLALVLVFHWWMPTPPLGDCWGGVLSEEALHCYVLEQAQRAGLIDVEKVYDADGVLYFSLRQDGPVGEEVYQFLKEKSYHFYDTWTEHVSNHDKYDTCMRWGYTHRECFLEKTGWQGRTTLPRSGGYTNILFHVGGEEARRSEPGWASWRQVWPAVADQSESRDVTDGALEFDVSDVDVTNIPEVKCRRSIGNSCQKMEVGTQKWGLPGWHSWGGTAVHPGEGPS